VFVLDPKGRKCPVDTRITGNNTGRFLPLTRSASRASPRRGSIRWRYLVGDSMITDAQTFADALIIGDDYFSKFGAATADRVNSLCGRRT
jgi:hypothetical protein